MKVGVGHWKGCGFAMIRSVNPCRAKMLMDVAQHIIRWSGMPRPPAGHAYLTIIMQSELWFQRFKDPQAFGVRWQIVYRKTKRDVSATLVTLPQQDAMQGTCFLSTMHKASQHDIALRATHP